MDAQLDEVINQLNALGLENVGWTYRGVFTEVLNQEPNDVVLIINQTLQVIQRNFGRYGSVNIGTGGIAYTTVRNNLLTIHQLAHTFIGANNAEIIQANFQNLLTFLGEPALRMEPYNAAAGPGGSGPAKMALNGAINTVHQRCSMVHGVLQLRNIATQFDVTI